MSTVLTLITKSPYFDFPQDWMGRVVAGLLWLLWLALIVVLLRRWRGYNKPVKRRFWGTIILLIVLTPLTSLFIGLRLPVNGGLPPPRIPVDPLGPALMIFAAIPWALAAGLFGPLPAAAIAGFSGIFLALWNTHNPFTPLELALLAVLFSMAVNQRYRTRWFRFLRQPIVAALLFGLVYPLVFVIVTVIAASGTLVNRLDYALTNVWFASLAMIGELLLAGLVAQVIAMAWPLPWGLHSELQPSPAEKSLHTRFLIIISPIVAIIILLLVVADWIVAGNAARLILRDRMADTAQVAASGVPYFLEVGQNQIAQFAKDERLFTSSPQVVSQILIEDLRRIPYFTQLYVLDHTGMPVAGFPQFEYIASQASLEEQAAIENALDGIPFQTYTVPSLEGSEAASVAFIAALFDQGDQVRGVLIGRTDLSENLFTSPILNSLKSLNGDNGIGILIDENRRILYHPESNLIMETYTGRTAEEADFFDDTAPDGTRQLVYYQPAEGRQWAILIAVPAQRVQQIALDIAAPLLLMIVFLTAILIVVLLYGLRFVTGSLQSLAVQAGYIARGQLDHPLVVEGVDEVGQLRRSFEQMRLSLKNRLDELNRLLDVSQGVAASLEMDEAVQPVLEAALSTGACSARVVLRPDMVPDLESEADNSPVVFSSGLATGIYAYLDGQIIELAHKQERLALTNLARTRLIEFPPEADRPEALIAVALRHENLYYGVLWLAYDTSHKFTQGEVRFLVTLASQAALAAANARLFLNAEIGRQRLAAILASTPDPVLVIDQQNRLLLANPAAWRVLGLGAEWEEGQPIEKLFDQGELLDLLQSAKDEKRSIETTLLDGRDYFATVSPVFAEGQRVGRVCVLRDVTYFKELDKMKSEFVATVSHDLRSPLTLMRGYATMLDMVGDLNEQQSSYVRKIVGGVESMSRLVNNLLDLGRIEAGVDLQLEMVPVYDVVDRVINGLQLQATQKNVELNADIADQTIPLLEADPALLQQALHNLVENAIKYNQPGGKVQVRLDTSHDHIVFIVRDTGIGISPVDQPHLFDKFYRGAHHGEKRQGGSGLGLAIVKSIAERHGGRVWLESKLGQGSTFYMIIPLRQSQRKLPEGDEGESALHIP